jgi:AraC-like DNA-binding protein
MALGRLAQGGLHPLMPLLEVDDTYRVAKQDPLMFQAVTFIGDHLGAGLRAAEVAAAAGLSVSRFLHRFKNATGETFHRHTARRLMAEACRRLVSSPVSNETIAGELGYRDAPAFNLAFRRAMGLPPGQWRRNQKPKSGP